MNSLNRRVAERVELSIPVVLGDQVALTRDISPEGVFFTSEDDLELEEGSSIRFYCELSHALPERPWKVEFCGRVVRIEQNHGQTGVAAKIERYRCLH
ncbi:MAG: hypothetical protein C0614_14425 [Desulfuromonas sp.]|nr:MAG: hypothetical protein C0614_14425 [Desulfuromonas sp.]